MLALLFAWSERLGQILVDWPSLLRSGPALSQSAVPSFWRRSPAYGLREPRWTAQTRRPPWACATNGGLEGLSANPNQGHLRLLKGRTLKRW